MHFQLMHESLARFSESFASFMYGLNMNAYCVDFPEARTSGHDVKIFDEYSFIFLLTSFTMAGPGLRIV